jgi:hypothetical protein
MLSKRLDQDSVEAMCKAVVKRGVRTDIEVLLVVVPLTRLEQRWQDRLHDCFDHQRGPWKSSYLMHERSSLFQRMSKLVAKEVEPQNDLAAALKQRLVL